MEENLAKQVIMEAIDLAFKKGCYGVVEATNIVNAIKFLNLNELKDNPNEQSNMG